MNDREVPTEDDNGRTPVGAVRAGCPGRHGLGTSPSATCFSVDVVGGLSVAPASSWAPTRETVAALVGQYYLCALWIPAPYRSVRGVPSIGGITRMGDYRVRRDVRPYRGFRHA